MLKSVKNLFIVMVLLSIVISCKSYHEGDMAVVKELFSTNGYELDETDLLNGKIVKLDEESKRVTSLHLSLKYNIKMIPPSISQLELLSLVNIATNNLESLPEEFCNLPNLVNLRVIGSGFRVLPDDLGKLKNLKIITLENTKVSALPSSLKKLEKLADVRISTEYFTDFPESLTSLPSLKYLTLDFKTDSPITLPAELANCEELLTLDLSGNISTIPKELSTLKKLKVLKVYGDTTQKAGYFTFPKEIYKIGTLEELGLFWCGLDYLPPGISALTKLKRLDLWHNHLEELPEDIYTMEQWSVNSDEDGYILKIPKNRICDVTPEQEKWLTQSVDFRYSTSQSWRDEQICE